MRGRLNVHSGPGGSLPAVLADLETIWSHTIQKQLDIPLKDLKVDRTTLSFTFNDFIIITHDWVYGNMLNTLTRIWRIIDMSIHCSCLQCTKLDAKEFVLHISVKSYMTIQESIESCVVCHLMLSLCDLLPVLQMHSISSRHLQQATHKRSCQHAAVGYGLLRYYTDTH